MLEARHRIAAHMVLAADRHLDCKKLPWRRTEQFADLFMDRQRNGAAASRLLDDALDEQALKSILGAAIRHSLSLLEPTREQSP